MRGYSDSNSNQCRNLMCLGATIFGSYYLAYSDSDSNQHRTRCRCFSLERVLVVHTELHSVMESWDSKLRNLEARVMSA